jgi:hypothetical protein
MLIGVLDGQPVSKRMSVDFMGMRVSFPQYLRLKAIQKEVIRMDQVMTQFLLSICDIDFFNFHDRQVWKFKILKLSEQNWNSAVIFRNH